MPRRARCRGWVAAALLGTSGCAGSSLPIDSTTTSVEPAGHLGGGDAPVPAVWGRAVESAEATDDVRLVSRRLERSRDDRETTVEYVVRNVSGEDREATLELALPPGAEVLGLWLDVGGVLMEGALLTSSRAHEVYGALVAPAATPRDPALLEVVHGRLVRLRIFPVPPAGTRRILLRWETPAVDAPSEPVLAFEASPGDPEDDRLERVRLRLRAPILPAPPARDRVYLLDESRSQGPGDLDAQSGLVQAALARHAATERFAIVSCAATCRTFPTEGLAAPSEAARAEAIRWVAARRASGASDVAHAIEQAAARAPRGALVTVVGDLAATAGPLAPRDVARAAEKAMRRAGAELRVITSGVATEPARARAFDQIAGATLDTLDPGAPGALPGEIARVVAALFERAAIGVDRIDSGGAIVFDDAPRRVLSGAVFEATGRLLIATGSPIEVTIVSSDGSSPRWGSTSSSPSPPLAKEPRVVGRNGSDAIGSGAIGRAWARARLTSLAMESDVGAALEAQRIAARFGLLDAGMALLALEDDAMYRRFGVAHGRGVGARAAPVGGDGNDRRLGDHSPRRERGEEGASGSPPTATRAGAAQSGGIPAEVIQRTVRAAHGDFRACTEAAKARDPDFSGRLALHVDIVPGGRAENVRPAPHGILDAAFVECVTEVFSRLVFPDPGPRKLTIIYPMVFPGRRDVPDAAPIAPVPTQPQLEVRVEELATWRVEEAPHVAVDPAREPHRALRVGEREVRALLAQHRGEEALPLARRLAARFGQAVAAQQLLAEAAAATGNGAEAARALEEVVELAPRDGDARAAVATALDALGEHGRACRFWRGFASMEGPGARTKDHALRCLEEAPLPPPAPSPAPGRIGAHAPCRLETPRPCPVAVIVDDRGRVASPWTPGPAAFPGLPILPGGSYRVRAFGAPPGERIAVEIVGLGSVRAWTIDPTTRGLRARLDLSTP